MEMGKIQKGNGCSFLFGQAKKNKLQKNHNPWSEGPNPKNVTFIAFNYFPRKSSQQNQTKANFSFHTKNRLLSPLTLYFCCYKFIQKFSVEFRDISPKSPFDILMRIY